VTDGGSDQTRIDEGGGDSSRTRGGTLAELVGRLESRDVLRSVLTGGVPLAGIEVLGITHDSRRVAPGSVFVAIQGDHHDGHDHVPAAVAAGAVGLVLERAVPTPGVPQVLVAAPRRALAVCAAWFEGDPSHRLGVVGITGTDGKTTTAYLVRSMLEAAGLPTGMLGTIDVLAGGQSLGNPGRATTPEAPELQAHLRQMVDAGDRWAVVESTSHGLAQDRVAEVAYDVAVHTNVTHEHLEFHRTPEAYRAAKRRLFERLAVGPANPDKGFGKHAVVNLDDPHAGIFVEAAAEAGATLHGYGADPGGTATIRVVSIRERDGLDLTIRTPRWEDRVHVRLAGRFNVHNTLAAIGVGEALELDPGAMRAGLEALERVPGRMEAVDLGQPFTVLVDYAHTPDALAKALDALAPLAAAGDGRLICVFGSAGDRDVAKRPMMGRVAGERCRLVVVTDEDPRSEDRMSILEQIAAGAERAGRKRGRDLLLIPDRATAIHEAIAEARPGDVVVLAGKGHERSIETADGPVPWDEAGAARAAILDRGFGVDR
jgi:UDP-N-acetylmuramoyl-L-alanyl-D-glutamate--2,6-diaminopimelate ligase